MPRTISLTSLVKWMKESVPSLDFSKYKGQAGKICVIGGSKEYTGAPYFAAISALLCGADLVHVICPEDAASVIKSYSPELIVHPLLNEEHINECCNWLRRMHAVVLGPGLGRDHWTAPARLVQFVRECDIPIVIDADGVQLVAQQPSLIDGYHRAILTPNTVEARVLYERLVIGGAVYEHGGTCAAAISRALNGVTVVLKGTNDIISDGNVETVCNTVGSPRRCGGQGDLLSGSMALFLSWTIGCNTFSSNGDAAGLECIVAAHAACMLTRRCANLAFAERERSVTTSDLIGKIGTAFKEHFELNNVA